uniref:SCP domain-containing protein n=1 Tax=Panagrellus redivivus TaxID=6233 RepID=A0A7E4V594_PANRE
MPPLQGNFLISQTSSHSRNARSPQLAWSKPSSSNEAICSSPEGMHFQKFRDVVFRGFGDMATLGLYTCKTVVMVDVFVGCHRNDSQFSAICHYFPRDGSIGMSIARRKKWSEWGQTKTAPTAPTSDSTMPRNGSPRRRVFSSSGPVNATNASTSQNAPSQRVRAASSTTSAELKVQTSIRGKSPITYSLRKGGKSPSKRANLSMAQLKGGSLLSKIASEVGLNLVFGYFGQKYQILPLSNIKNSS